MSGFEDDDVWWNLEYSLCLYQFEELAERGGPSDLLQDLCQRTVSHHPLPQQVSYISLWAVVFHMIRFHTRGAANKELLHGSSPLHRENKPQKGGICVANHTSPIDVVILANDGCYAMVGITYQQVNVSFISDVLMLWCLCCVLHFKQVGQIHGGLMGVIQRSMVRSCPHVWFERSEMKDRHAVTSRWDWWAQIHSCAFTSDVYRTWHHFCSSRTQLYAWRLTSRTESELIKKTTTTTKILFIVRYSNLWGQSM